MSVVSHKIIEKNNNRRREEISSVRRSFVHILKQIMEKLREIEQNQAEFIYFQTGIVNSINSAKLRKIGLPSGQL